MFQTLPNRDRFGLSPVGISLLFLSFFPMGSLGDKFSLKKLTAFCDLKKNVSPRK